ncbi:homoserine dehydrogenase [cyanobiont of Ornithocercus magnificus]|nr:homoserine dehydrogenase [cyanobiont of Ornithocercus magnificus]
MGTKIGVGLLGLGTVGAGVVKILRSPQGRHPLVQELELARVAVRDLGRPRPVTIPLDQLTTDPKAVVDDPAVQVVVEVIGGIEPARSLIMRAVAAGKSVVTANKAVIARHGEEITAAAATAGVYVLTEAAVGGGIPIIEPLKQFLGANRIQRVSGIINATTNYILSRMAQDEIAYDAVLEEAQAYGYAELDPSADVNGLDAADKIAILAGLAFGGSIDRASVSTVGISNLQRCDVDYAGRLGYNIKLLSTAERTAQEPNLNMKISQPLAVYVCPTLIPKNHLLADVNGVNNAILVEGEPIGQLMFHGPGAGAGPTASAIVGDILNIASICRLHNNRLSYLPTVSNWQNCHLVQQEKIQQRNYIRIQTHHNHDVAERVSNILNNQGVPIQSVTRFDTANSNDGDTEIIIISHKVSRQQISTALRSIKALREVTCLAAHLNCL